MYIHPTFETDGSFTLLHPVYTSLLTASVLLLVLILLPLTRRKFLNGFAVVSLSFIMAWLAVQLIYFDAIIVDEIGSGGSAQSTFMALGIIGFGFLNPLVYYVKWTNQKRSS